MEVLTCFLIFFCASLELISGKHEDAFGVYSYRNRTPRSSQVTTLDVTSFGAVGDGITNDSKAFKLAWSAACQKATDIAKVTVPSGKRFLVSPIEFGGPCKCHNITLEILGSIVAQLKSAWKIRRGEWLKFQRVDGLTVVGNGQGLIDGQGDSWWRNVS